MIPRGALPLVYLRKIGVLDGDKSRMGGVVRKCRAPSILLRNKRVCVRALKFFSAFIIELE